MFGLSFAETAVIFLVALVAIGPKELPTVIRAVARTLGQLKGLAAEFRRNFDELAEEAKLKDLHDEITTAMPTIIDMEGNEQRIYDISDELKKDEAKRKPKTEPNSKVEASDE